MRARWRNHRTLSCISRHNTVVRLRFRLPPHVAAASLRTALSHNAKNQRMSLPTVPKEELFITRSVGGHMC